ncbi:MAG: flavodoxin family protein [Lentilitoribacter sp.]
MENTKKVIVIYHSGYGHTKVQAEAVLAGAQSIDGVEAELIDAKEAASNLDRIDEADAVVFGSPTYMGTISAEFKAFMDASSSKWMQQGWKDKIAGGFTNSASQVGDKTGTLQALSVFAAQHGMIWVGLDLPPGNNSSEGTDNSLNRMGASLGAMAQSLADQGPDVSPPDADQKTAHYYGARIAQAAIRWAA